MLLNHDEVKNILPHRDPLLLVSQAEIEDNEVCATLFVDPSWDIFKGHFPEKPVLPGVYLVESMAQAADILIMSDPKNKGKLPYFAGINKIRFIRPVYPGNTIVLTAEITSDAGNGLYECKTTALIAGKEAAQGYVSIMLKE